MDFIPENGRWPSPFNQAADPAALAGRRIRIADCTLRDGEQQAGIVLNSDDKVAIARSLDALGVHEIEAGTVASSQEDREAIGRIVQAGLNAKISVLCRGINGDIDMAQDVGAWGVRLSFPVSDIEREYKLKGVSEDEYLARALALAEYAAKKNLAVIFSPFDTTRASLPFLRRIAAEFARAGTVDRVRIVDTTGCALPQAISMLVDEVVTAGDGIPVEIHCHNDFGLSCANTLAGVQAGADYVSSTINGIGERCGNASTEEVVMALEILYGYETGLRLERLKGISQEVETLTGIRLSPNKAVVGENAFRHEAGMVVAGLLKNPFTAESYAPEIVGQQRGILLGKKSGVVSVQHKALQLGLEVPEHALAPVLEAVKADAVRLRRSLDDDEFVRVVHATLADLPRAPQ
ncbi:hypothetical protein [Bordetella genomosp. 13]|uniref:homocitrate synthase/isopropylmalate synthase family protein n=1 Tax=Bordetella genomosp. 13 TaxID=463040 RepID=UPI0016423EBC|nr:hypothetical protein [Bordetella genomosp. 13]